MSLSTSYRAFKILELLRLRCRLTARDVADTLMLINESAYSRLRSNLDAEHGVTLAADSDIKVRVALAVIEKGIRVGVLPMDADARAPTLEKLAQYRKDIAATYESRDHERGVTTKNQLTPLNTLVQLAKVYAFDLLDT